VVMTGPRLETGFVFVRWMLEAYLTSAGRDNIGHSEKPRPGEKRISSSRSRCGSCGSLSSELVACVRACSCAGRTGIILFVDEGLSGKTNHRPAASESKLTMDHLQQLGALYDIVALSQAGRCATLKPPSNGSGHSRPCLLLGLDRLELLARVVQDNAQANVLVVVTLSPRASISGRSLVLAGSIRKHGQ
jgi:hypothetical protein